MRVYVPPPSLSQYVDYFWLQEGAAPRHTLERIVPTGTTELVIALGDPPLRTSTGSAGGVLQLVGSAMVCGAQSSPFVVDTRAQTLLIGVHFRPGGAFPFFNPSAAELRDLRVGLDELEHATLHRALQPRGRIDTQALLPHSPLPRSSLPDQFAKACGMGRCRAQLRLFRPSPFRA